MNRRTWRTCLYRFWRLVRIPLAVLMTLCLCTLYMCQVHFSFCAYCSSTVTPKQGNFRAVYIGRYCEYSGEIGRVVLRRTDGQGRDTPVFVYIPADGPFEPSMAWLGPDELEISLDQVYRILSRKEEALGVRIIYRIGRIGP